MNNFLSFNREEKLIIFFLAVSCFHRVGLLISMVLLLLLLQQGAEGGVKALVLLAIRTPLSTAVAVQFSGALQTFKWILIFGISGFILLYGSNIPYVRKGRLRGVLLSSLLFVFIATLGSIMNSSYPVTAIFKIFSYCITMSALLIGVAATDNPEQLLRFSVKILTPLMIACILIIPMGQFRLVNASFQGVFNHPNMLGIMGAVYVGLLIMYKKYFDQGSIVMIFAVLSMLFLSASRTGMISAVLAIAIAYKYIFNAKSRKLAPIALLIFIAVMAFNWSSIQPYVYSFIFKSNATSLLDSREVQIEGFKLKFLAHPFLGSGFAVPFSEGIREGGLNLNLRVEPGNIIWAVLGDCGILGMISFLFYAMVMTFRQFDFQKIVFVMIPFLVSMGEMAFFSVNSIAMIYYLMFGLYMFIDM